MNRFMVLGYHDVTDLGREDSSGVPGLGAYPYKLLKEDFDRQMSALKRQGDLEVISLPEIGNRDAGGKKNILLSFDDGGLSAYTNILGTLEEMGMTGHFFVIGGAIGKACFVNASQIRALRRNGHIIGSHSYTHPDRISSLSAREIDREWQESIAVLEDILGEKINLASVPNGYYNEKVIEAAARAGIKWLFTSDPTTSVKTCHGCTIVGRYAIQRGHDENYVTAIARRKLTPRIKQAFTWKLKGIAKVVGGSWYLKARRNLLKKHSNVFK